MDRQPTNLPIDRNRLNIRKTLIPEWKGGQEVLFLPLAWGRDIYLPESEFIGAWAVIDRDLGRDKASHSAWIESISEIESQAEESDHGRDLWQLKQQAIVNAPKDKNTIWQITIPLGLRNMGVFPMETGNVAGLKETVGISVWYKPALVYHLAHIKP